MFKPGENEVDLDKCGTLDGVTPLPDCEGTGQPCPDQDALVSDSYHAYRASIAAGCEGWRKMTGPEL